MSAEVETALAKYLKPKDHSAAVALLDESQLGTLEMWCAEIATIGTSLTPAETAEQAHELDQRLHRARKAAASLEDLRTARVAPLNREVKAVNDLFRPLTEALKNLVTKGNGYVIAWTEAEQRRIQREREERERQAREAATREAALRAKAEAAKSEAARRKATEEADKAAEVVSVALAVPEELAPTRLRNDEGLTSLKDVWDFEVIKPEDVPRAYLAVDVGVIRKAVNAGAREIPGVNIFSKKQVSRRA